MQLGDVITHYNSKSFASLSPMRLAQQLQRPGWHTLRILPNSSLAQEGSSSTGSVNVGHLGLHCEVFMGGT